MMTLYMILIPLVLAIGINFLSPSINDTSVNLALVEGENREQAEYFDDFAHVLLLEDKGEVERRIGARDDVLGVLADGDSYYILAQGNEPESVVEYAKLLHQQGKRDEAINTIEDIRAVDPENIEALMLMGQILQDQGKYDKALETYKEISFIDPDNASAIYEQAEVYLAQEKLLWAEKYYKKALAKNARLGLAVFGLAKIAKLRKNDALYKLNIGVSESILNKTN